MPVFWFYCLNCGIRFSIVSYRDASRDGCPKCSSTNTKRIPSKVILKEAQELVQGDP